VSCFSSEEGRKEVRKAGRQTAREEGRKEGRKEGINRRKEGGGTSNVNGNVRCQWKCKARGVSRWWPD
jgi:hypothetical protein